MKKLLLIPFLFIACKTQKSSTEHKEVIRIDTFLKTEINTIYEPINDTLYLPSICDSLIPFHFSKSIPNGKATLSKVGNNLSFIINTNRSIQTSKLESQKSLKDFVEIKEKLVIKYRTPSWILATIIIESIVILLYLYFRFLILR